MKKILILLVVCMLFMSGCSKDEVAQKIQDDISSIGEVTLDDESLIEKVYEEYNTLTDKQKNQVENYADLLEARDEIEILKAEAEETAINQIIGNWNGLAIFSDNELTAIDKGIITGTISNDNTFEFKVNDTKLSGVWANIDSDQLSDGEYAYNFVSYEGEQVAQGILSTKNEFIDPNSTYTLSMFFDDGNLSVQFEK